MIRPGTYIITVAKRLPPRLLIQSPVWCYPSICRCGSATYNINMIDLLMLLGQKRGHYACPHFGKPVQPEVITRYAENGLWLIEDCCDALGSTYDGKMVGTFGDIGTLSFYPAHHNHGGRGRVFMKSGKLRKIAESFRDWGRDCYCPWR